MWIEEAVPMPIHDWTRVDAGIFHSFHLHWVCEIGRVLNGGLLPADYYGLSETIINDADQGYVYAVRSIAVRHASDHRLIGRVEIVAPESKNDPNRWNIFVQRKREALTAGINLLLVDLFPPSSRDPQGIHRAIWGEDYAVLSDKPLTCAAYVGGAGAQAFIEPVAVGDALPEMPLFLTPEIYVPVPLEATYQSAWVVMPTYWREVLTAGPEPAEEL
jgi:hypothetical protein